MRRFQGIGTVLLAVLAMAGCQTRGQNLPLEEAKFRVIKPNVPERTQVVPAPAPPAAEVIRMDAGLWQPGFRQYRLAQRSVQPVGRAGGQTFYALSWDRAPFDRLLVEVPGRPGAYLEFLQVY
jgi:hypothetical protein